MPFALIEEEEEPTGEEEGIEKVVEIVQQVSTEKPLTKQQQEMVEKIRKCIGI